MRRRETPPRRGCCARLSKLFERAAGTETLASIARLRGGSGGVEARGRFDRPSVDRLTTKARSVAAPARPGQARCGGGGGGGRGRGRKGGVQDGGGGGAGGAGAAGLAEEEERVAARRRRLCWPGRASGPGGPDRPGKQSSNPVPLAGQRRLLHTRSRVVPTGSFRCGPWPPPPF